jgi:manganese transport protein
MLYILHSANRTDTQIRPHRPAANGRQFALLRSTLRNRPDGCVINASILILVVSFSRVGFTDVTEVQGAHRLLTPVLGNGIASVLFAVALLASGQMSAVAGTLAGQVVIEGFLRWKVSPAIRRLVTRALAMAPASLSFCSMAEGGGLLMRKPASYPVPASTKQLILCGLGL